MPEAVHVTAQILRGLHRAHKAGIVHRDLKPDNIFLVDRDDNPNFAKILDFGISKVRRQGETPVHTLTRQGTVLGTPFYMSPEQAQAQPDVDARSDLWSVGAILFECLTGRPPYTGATYEQVIVNICMNDADDVRLHNPGVPEPVAQVIARALARNRDDRFHDAREFLDALRAGSGGLISARQGALAGEDSFAGVSSSDPGGSPVSSGRTPSTGSGRRRSPPVEDPALDATLKFHSTPPPDPPRTGSLVSRRRAAAARQRRMFLLTAFSALAVGGLGAFVFARVWAHPPDRSGPPSQGVSLAESARPQPVDSAVARALPPSTPTPLVGPAPDVSASAAPSVEPMTTPPADTGEPRGKAPKVTRNGAPPPPTTSSARTPPRPPDTAAPTTTGVASGLKLKTD